jgi:hypothetical protein
VPITAPERAPLRVEHPMLQMQRVLGNQAVASLVEELSGSREPERVRPKLRVGQPGNAYEQEADRVADRVMTMSGSGEAFASSPVLSAPPPRIQRLEAEEEEDEQEAPVATDAEDEGEDEEVVDVQAKAAPGGRHEDGRADDVFVPRGGGAPLSQRHLDFFEPRFGHDFSRVRIHTGERAAASARSLGALAYTVGPNVVLGEHDRSPDSGAARHLLAHELTHVVQQGHAPAFSRGAAARPTAAAAPAIMPYRAKGSANFGACDTATLVEGSFNTQKDKSKKPWIEKIKVDFTGTKNDADGDLVPTGKLVADYHANSAKKSQVKADIVGGKASQGLTDKKDAHTVKRIEGCGYHHTSVPKAKRIKGHKRAGKYFANVSDASMSFAVFFVQGKSSGNQAIHEGSLSTGSLACVHVSNTSTIQQINYHSVAGLTKVAVAYDAAALEKVCCARFNAVGRMVSNPCKGQDKTKC